MFTHAVLLSLNNSNRSSDSCASLLARPPCRLVLLAEESAALRGQLQRSQKAPNGAGHSVHVPDEHPYKALV